MKHARRPTPAPRITTQQRWPRSRRRRCGTPPRVRRAADLTGTLQVSRRGPRRMSSSGIQHHQDLALGDRATLTAADRCYDAMTVGFDRLHIAARHRRAQPPISQTVPAVWAANSSNHTAPRARTQGGRRDTTGTSTCVTTVPAPLACSLAAWHAALLVEKPDPFGHAAVTIE
jgi:hypothetical protein